MPLDSTVGGANANSYVDVAFALSYFEGHVLGGSWLDAPSTQSASLIQASTMLDSLVSWLGYVESDSIQSMDWPRVLSGGAHDGAIPIDLMRSVCELALYLIQSGSTVTDDSMSKIAVGPIKLEFNSDKEPVVIPALVSAMLSELGTVKSPTGLAAQSIPLLRV